MFWCSLVGADRPPKEAMPVAIVCLRAGRFGFWYPLLGAESDSFRENSPWRSHFPPGQGTFRKIGVQFWRKVDVAGYTTPLFGHGRVKVGVDQSAMSVSRCK